MEIKKELIKRDIAGDTVLVPVGKAVLREYDIDEDTARSDTAEFFEKLRGFGIID